MKTNILTLIVVLASASIIAIMTACETTPAAGGPEISPSTATITKGQSIQFTASGGYEYTWSINNATLGVLSTLRGPSTVYTSIYDPGSNNTSSSAVIQVLTVTSIIEGSSTSTNNANYVRTGEAHITHMPSE